MKRQLTAPDPALEALDGLDSPALLLHSGRRDRHWAHQSLLGRPRAWYRFDAECGGRLLGLDRPLRGRSVWEQLRELLNDPALPGVWIGYFSYDLGRLIEPGKLASPQPSPWPLVELGWCPQPQVFESQDPPAEPTAAADPPAADPVRSNLGRDGYLEAVQRIGRYIAAGDVFQVNVAQRFSATFAGSLRDLYKRLAAISPAWFGACLELPGNRGLASISPELFLAVDGDRVVTRPIKGTRPADRSAEELAGSEKDLAELNMIVDLMRNDLGRVCDYGSVAVTEARRIESHPTVHHATATIEGRLHPDRDVVDLLAATLPGGSVTGAPKVRAMQIIDELEPAARGPYCGCIGYLSADRLRLSVAIRTLLMEGSQVSFSVGAGIVADSNPEAEYAETLDKAAALLRALGAARPD